jgi:hypothetical protein
MPISVHQTLFSFCEEAILDYAMDEAYSSKAMSLQQAKRRIPERAVTLPKTVWDAHGSRRITVSMNTYLLTYLLTYSLTHSLTPWCRIFFEKLIVTQLVKQ